MKNIYYKYNIFYIFISILILINIFISFFLFINKGCFIKHNIVAFLNIGQGDSIYIENSLGKSILIDTGNKDSEVLKQIKKVVSCYKININTLLLTHSDQDHIGESYNLVQKGYVNNILHNGFLDINQPNENKIENDLEEIIKTKNIKTQKITSSSNFEFENFNIDFLYPINEPYSDKKGKGKNVDDNDYSIVLKLIYKNISFMLTGDAPMKAEKDIIQKYCSDYKHTEICPILKSDVLKLGHHGSKNSSDIDWLKKVDAKEYIISAGLNNKYNHPNEETIYRIKSLNKKDYQIRETFKEGNIVYILD